MVSTSVLPSLYVPVATRAWVVPSANEGLAGVTAIESKMAGPTLSVAEAVMEPEVAVMVAVPTPVPVANPLLAMVATVAEDELQVTELVRVCVLPSLYVPVAANCWLAPLAIDALPGLTDNDTRTGAVTATLTEPVTAPELALMLVVPSRLPITNPALTDATAGEEDVHVAEDVRSCVLPSV